MKRSAVLFAVGSLFSAVSMALADSSINATSILAHLVPGRIAQALLHQFVG